MDFETAKEMHFKPIFRVEPEAGGMAYLQVVHQPDHQFELWFYDKDGKARSGMLSSKLTQPVVTLDDGRLAVYFPGNDLHGDPFSCRFESHIHLIVRDYGEQRISTRDCYNDQHQPQLPEGGTTLEPIEDESLYQKLMKMEKGN